MSKRFTLVAVVGIVLFYLGLLSQASTVLPQLNAILTGAYAALPASSSAGNLYFTNDSLYVLRWSGSAWAPFGPVFPLTVPSGSFSWDNQGTSTITTTSGSFVLSTPTASTGLAVRYMTAPAAPYTVTALLIPGQLATDTNNQNPQVGLVFRQSSTNELVIFGPYSATSLTTPPTPRNIAVSKWTDSTNFSGVYSTVTFGGSVVSPVWLRIADDNTNRICSYSGDGLTWVPFHTVGRTDFLTADQVGFATNVAGSAAAINVRVVSWLVQ